MLNKEEIQLLVIKRLLTISNSCDRIQINRCEGELGVLLAVLNDGKKIGLDGSANQVLDAAGIPWTPHPDRWSSNGGWWVDDAWLEERGCTVDGNNICHPKLEDW